MAVTLAPLRLALWTGQRQGDLLRLPWSAYDGITVRLRQSKTGRRVAIRVGEPLRVALAGSGTGVMLAGITSRFERCQPAWSSRTRIVIAQPAWQLP